MLCDMCHKNKATVHLTEIIDEQVAELHLCEECARKKSFEMEQHFGLADLLAGLADFGSQSLEPTEVESIKCNNCGLTYADFRKIGRLGCSECYTTFRKNLEPLLRRIHGSTQHVGKSPTLIEPSAVVKSKREVPDLERLKLELQKAIKAEAFEEAAKLRDKIKELEKKSKK